MHATLAVNLSRQSVWLKVLGSHCPHLCWCPSPAPLGELMRVTSSESGYMARWLRYEAVVVSISTKAKAAPMDHFLSDALAQVTILL